MADQSESTAIDVKTRANLAYLWSIAVIVMVGYTLWEYGHILAVLTLLIGFITGTAATVLAVYFGAPITSRKPDTTIPVTGDNTTVNNQPPVQ
jgi:hypothetical protein